MNKLMKSVGAIFLALGMLLGISAPAQAAFGINYNKCTTKANVIAKRSPAPGFYVKPGQPYHVRYVKSCLSTPTWFNQKVLGQKPRMVVVASWSYNPMTNKTYNYVKG